MSSYVIITHFTISGIYFSAHWCPPCRGFTPILSKFYTAVKEKYGDEKLEIVFVSSDRDEAAFNDYFGEMPWCALPYEAREAKVSIPAPFRSL